MSEAAAYGGLAALQLAGGYFASQNIKATAELNRDISEMNAQFAELDAYDAALEGHTRQTRYQSVIDNTLAEQSTSLLAQDVDIHFGSAATLASETKFMGELNMMEIQKEAQNRALGYGREARNTRLSGALQYGADRTRAGQAMFQGVVGAAQTGLTGYKRASAGGSSTVVDDAAQNEVNSKYSGTRDYVSRDLEGYA